jgi:aspartate/methionine/tyrosine aminotransferase
MSRPSALGPISEGLDPASLGELAKALHEFHAEYTSLQEDEISRFPFLCDAMFSTFTSRNVRRLEDGSTTDWIPAGGNLDTGDAGFPPPEAALAACTDEATASRDLPRYIGPETEEVLQDALFRFLRHQRFPLADRLDSLGTVVGCGTVNLFDAVCRDLVHLPGDVVLMPSVGYGFFLAQPYRAGGRVAIVDGDGTGRIQPAELRTRIAEIGQSLYEEWLPHRRHHTAVALRDAERRGLVALPGDEAGLSTLVDALVEGLPSEAESGRALLRRRVLSLLPMSGPVRGDPRRDLTNLVRPPAVRAWLHINPGVTGCVYDEQEIAGLAEVLRASGVAVIEDLAYHSVRMTGEQVHSFQGLVPTCHTLFGVSKPFALANARIGLMLVAAQDVSRLRRMVENAVGFVPLAAQRMAAAALGGSRPEASARYLAHASGAPETGYGFRLSLLTLMLRGAAAVPPDPAVEAAVSRYALELLAAKRRAGTDVTGGEDGDRRLVAEFLADGLSRWFAPMNHPEAGFFQVVSCRRLLDRGTLRRVGLPAFSAFDVFAFLAWALGVRTIPEEGMRLPTHGTHLLRMAFSPRPRLLVESLLTTYAALRFIESSGNDREVNHG